VKPYAIADIASIIADTSRAAMLVSLLDGEARTATELARIAQIAPATASAHLRKLVLGGLIEVWPQGRHRYFRLASGDVGHALEGLGSLTPRPPARSLTPSAVSLRRARTCYQHLAGRIAVELAASLESRGCLVTTNARTFDVTQAGEIFFREAFGVEVVALRAASRPVARWCLDWTERRPHVGGALGRAMLARLVSIRWLRKAAGSRAVDVTTLGERELRRLGMRTVSAA